MKIKKMLVLLGLFALTGAHSNAQTIDYEWVNTIQSPSTTRCLSTTTDANGNVYTTGTFSGTADFDPGSATLNIMSKGGNDIFVQKLDNAGNLLWAVTYGDIHDDQGNGISLDKFGNVLVTGFYKGTANFTVEILQSNLNRTQTGQTNDVFVIKLNAGGTPLWAKSFGGAMDDAGNGVTSDNNGDVIITGNYGDDGHPNTYVDFDPSISGVYSPPYSEANDASDTFIEKLDANGNFLWVNGLAYGGLDYGSEVITDGANNIYAIGTFSGHVHAMSSGQIANDIGMADVFVMKFPPGGSLTPTWMKVIGSTGNDFGRSIDIDSDDNLLIGGSFSGTADFDPNTGTVTIVSNGGLDAFSAKMSSDGNLMWAKRIGGLADDETNCVRVDAYNNVFLTGYFSGMVDFDPGSPYFNQTAQAASEDAFIMELLSDGSFAWASALVGTGGGIVNRNHGISLAVSEGCQAVYTAGFFENTVDFDHTPLVDNVASAGNTDGFVHKIQISNFTQPTLFTYNITCVGYNQYSIDFQSAAANAHHWQVYDHLGNELTAISLYGTSNAQPSIIVNGNGGDIFTVKHGTYGAPCQAWAETIKQITLPCYSNLDPGFSMNYNCTNNQPTITVQGNVNPCNTHWQFDLYKVGDPNKIEGIAWFNNNNGSYNSDSYVLTPADLEPCTDYKIVHGVYSACEGWTASSQTFNTGDCPALVPDFFVAETSNGAPQTVFYTCDDLFFNGTDSEMENNYFLDLWKSDGAGGWISLAKKGTTGWTAGEAGIFDLRAEFGPKGVSFSPGIYKIKLALNNKCHGWLPVEKTFEIKTSVGTPTGVLATYESCTYQGIPTYCGQWSFTPNDAIWLDKIPTYTNNHTSYRIDVYESTGINTWSGFKIGEIPLQQGLFHLTELKSNIVYSGNTTIQVNKGYRLKFFTFNECGDYALTDHDFMVRWPTPEDEGPQGYKNGQINSNGSLEDITINLFPNPANTYLTIETDSADDIFDMKVIDQLGKTVMAFSNYQNKINVASLPAGMYFLIVSTKDGKIHENFIKN